MGKKGNWFSAIKRVFTPNSVSKDKQLNKDAKEKKKKGIGKVKDGGSFIPLFKQASSIEEILGEAEREHYLIDYYRPISPYEQPSTRTTPPSRSWTPTPPQRTSATTPTPGRNFAPQMVVPPMNGGSSSTSQRAFLAPKIASPVSSLNVGGSSRSTSSRYVHRPRAEPNQNLCATRIQAAYKGYAARRKYRSVRGLVRLQGVLKGHSVERQTANAMKYMQLVVRVQSQIQSRRIQVQNINEKLNLRQLQLFENDGWEDSRVSKEEIEARAERKYQGMMRRERAMAYAYSHQPSPKTPNYWSARTTKPHIFSTPPRPNTTSPFGLRRNNDYYQHLGSPSLTSCPAAPRRYMEATAKAKLKIGLQPSSPNTRGSFAIGSFKRASLFTPTPTPNREKLQSCIGNLSVDSTTSMPAALGRKPFNRGDDTTMNWFQHSQESQHKHLPLAYNQASISLHTLKSSGQNVLSN